MVVFMAAVLAVAPSAHAADAQIEDAALKPVEAMGKTLSAPQFSFKIRTIREYTNASGQPLTIFHEGSILVRRPDRFRADITGDDGRVSVAYDGKELALLGVEQKKYVTVAFAGDIEGTLQLAEQRLGFEFPLADFLVKEPHKAFLSGVAFGTKVNEVSIGGVTCDHLLFMQPPGIELQLWVETGARPVPRRLVATYRSLPGEPRFIAEMNDWNFAATPTEADFTLQIPPGSQKLEPPKEGTQ